MRFHSGIFIVAAALEFRVHRPICLANESLLIYGIYELQTLVSVHLHERTCRMFSNLFVDDELIFTGNVSKISSGIVCFYEFLRLFHSR